MQNDESVIQYRLEKEEKYKNYIKSIKIKDTSKKKSIKTSIGYIDIYIYYPKIKKNNAVYFNFHGGGFVLGQYELDSPYCKLLSDLSGATIVNVDYCLSPEFKFPKVYYTSYEVIEWCFAHASELNMSNECFIVGGNSAGGNIAAGIVQLSNKTKMLIKGLVMNYSPCKQDLIKKNSIDSDKAISESRVLQYINWQFDNMSDLTSPLASPVYSDVSVYPPTMVNTAGYDSLLEEEIELADKLRNKGISVDYKCYENCMHGYTHKELKEYNEKASSDTWKRISDFINTVSKRGAENGI